MSQMETKTMKRIFHVLLALLVLLSLLPPPDAIAAPDDTVYIRKHVSILYDNSGSMKEHISGEQNLKWCYASYAAQMFTGLLNDTDSLSITFMEGDSLSNLDLKGLRQDAVSSVLNRTSSANADTPIARIGSALSVLEKEGLKPGLGTNDAGEQFWLVLTTDGVFRENSENLSAERVASELEAIMDKYPDLHVVYFGIGTQNDRSTSKAVDFRVGSEIDAGLLNRLHSHPNFTAVYAENQEQIVATMQNLSNQISGRYSVSDEVVVSGNQVRLYLSGEGSPIRNIAVMAQETNAKLLSVTSEDGAELTIDRQAEIRFPHNASYDNVPDGTLGGYVALITSPDGSKVPNGNIVLNYSEPVSSDKIALMYEPANHIRLQIERKQDDGEWQAVPENADLVEGDEIRAVYAICEDGTDKELDTAKLFGKTEAIILYNGNELQPNETVVVELGDSLLDVRVSMMDGGYQINTSRTIHVIQPGAGDFTVQSSGPIELQRSAVANNSDQAVDFSILFRGEPVDASYASKVSLHVTGEDGDLKGQYENPESHIFRFVPKDADCLAGTYIVHLLFEETEIASEEIRVLPNETTYTAEAGPSISIMSNQVSSNTDAVVFTVTAHRDGGDEPITATEAELFTIRAEGNGLAVSGSTGWQEGGTLNFILQDPSASAGNYDVSIWRGDEKLAQTYITIVQYDATYTVETIISDPDTVDRFDLLHNSGSVSFIVYEDGVPCSSAQLEAMLGRQLILSDDLASRFAEVKVQIGMANGKPAIVCTPTSTTSSGLRIFFRRILIAVGTTGLNRDQIQISLTADMPHGDSGAGALRLTGYRVIYLIILLAFLAILVLIALFIFANVKALRLIRGNIWTFTMRNDDSVGGLRANKIGTSTPIGWGWKPMLLVPVDETHLVNNVRFEARKGPARRTQKKPASLLGFRRVHPTVLIKGTASEVDSYYRSDVSGIAAPLLRQIKGGSSISLVSGEMPLDASTFFSYVAKISDTPADTGAVSAPVKGKKGKKRSAAKPIQSMLSGSKYASYKITENMAMVYRVTGSGENERYTVWVYEAARRDTDSAKKHKHYSSGKNSAKRSAAGKKTKKQR